MYAVLAQKGFFPEDELDTFRKINSRLQGHAHIKTPGVEMSGGSLGQGLSFGLGCALSARIDSDSYHTYVLLGDGECDEGQIWEAAMAAAHYGLDNLTVIVDRNRIQNDRFTDEVMKLEPFADKWKAFGWNVLKIDGHDFASLIDAFASARKHSNQPTVIIADTVKGKGISFMERFIYFFESLSIWVGRAFGWCILILTLSVTYEVFVRYVLNAPTVWVFDMMVQMYGGLFLMAGPYALAQDAHVRGDVLYRLFPVKTQAWIDLVLYIFFFFPGMLALFWFGYEIASDSWRYKEVSWNSPARIQIYYFKSLIPLAGGLLIILGISECMRCILCLSHIHI